jgi:hypothetical protein
MSDFRDSLIRLRQMFFDRTMADTSRATGEVLKARELLNLKRGNLDSIGEGREAVSNQLQALDEARWLANLLAFDRQLAGDMQRARQEVDRAEGALDGRREDLSGRKMELAHAQARLLAAQNLARRRRRAARRRRERRMEEVSGIRARCL